jgi:hypothetical protein
LVLIACSVVSVETRADDVVSDEKSESVATGLSLGITAAGVGLIALGVMNAASDAPLHDALPPLLTAGVAGVVLGPSAGRWYARDAWSAGLGLRLAGAAGFAIGSSLALSELYKWRPQRDTSTFDLGLRIGAVGGAAFVTGVVLDLATAHRAVERYNRAHAARKLSVVPTVVRAANAPQAGLAVIGTF